MGRHVDGMPLPTKRRADERDGAERPTGKHKPVQCGVAATVLIFWIGSRFLVSQAEAVAWPDIGGTAE
jgi:hypothetical protein